MTPTHPVLPSVSFTFSSVLLSFCEVDHDTMIEEGEDVQEVIVHALFKSVMHAAF